MNKSKILITLFIVIIALMIGIKLNEKKEITNIDELDSYSGDNETQILLYFSSLDGSKLEQEYRYVSFNNIRDNMYETIITELINGPISTDTKATIPSDTTVKSITQDGNKVIVNFSEEFNSNVEVSEIQKIYSVVNTLTEIKEINEVEIQIEGETITTEKRI